MSNIKDLHCKPRLGIATLLHKIVFFIVGCIHLQSMPLTMLTMKKELHGLLFLCSGFVDISYGALLGRPLGGWSSAII